MIIYPPDATKPPDDDGNIIASDRHKKQLRSAFGKLGVWYRIGLQTPFNPLRLRGVPNNNEK
jgi:hypothetical protein